MKAEEALLKCAFIVGSVLMLSLDEIDSAAAIEGLRPEYRDQILAIKRCRVSLDEALAAAWKGTPKIG
jgi:hypothetical protein